MTWRYALRLVSPTSAEPRGIISVDPDSAALSVTELGMQRGDGVFESVAVIDGHPQEVSAHLDRLAASARACALPAPERAQWERAIADAAAAAPGGEVALKLLIVAGADGPLSFLAAATAPDNTAVRARGLALVALDRGYDSGAAQRAPWLLLGAKTMSYAVNVAAGREARRRGADEALFVSSDGVVLEGATSSFLVRLDGRYLTPARESGILPGTTQESLFAFLREAGEDAAEQRLTLDELERVDAAWLVSSVRLAVPVRSIDQRTMAVDAVTTARMNRYLLSPRD